MESWDNDPYCILPERPDKVTKDKQAFDGSKNFASCSLISSWDTPMLERWSEKRPNQHICWMLRCSGLWSGSMSRSPWSSKACLLSFPRQETSLTPRDILILEISPTSLWIRKKSHAIRSIEGQKSRGLNILTCTREPLHRLALCSNQSRGTQIPLKPESGPWRFHGVLVFLRFSIYRRGWWCKCGCWSWRCRGISKLCP